jgi:hypothetical protein
LRNMLDPLFTLDHEGERPKGMTLAVGTVTGRSAATAARSRKISAVEMCSNYAELADAYGVTTFELGERT